MGTSEGILSRVKEAEGGQNKRITSLIESKIKLTDQINYIIYKNLYLETYSRRENTKVFNTPEVREEDTEEVLRNFMEQELGHHNARNVETQVYTV